MSRQIRSDAGFIVPAITVLIVAMLAAGPLLLHFTQNRHNQLPTPDARFSAEEGFVPGEVYASTLVTVMEHELDSSAGWRPNDFFLWGPTLWADNNSNRQIGIILAMRESVRVFKDHLTKISSDEYDDNLKDADTLFRNDERKLWLPSAESKFRSGVKDLEQYIRGLKKDPMTSRPITARNVELIRLFQAWTDLLGGAHARLYDEKASWFAIDDYFYQAQGMTHVMNQLVQAVHLEYAKEIGDRPALETLFKEVSVALHHAAVLKPVIILDGSPDGLLANHRRNLAAYINEARQKMYSIREELEK